VQRTSECPGGCGTQVARRRFACKPCWYRLPESYRDAIKRNHHRNTEARFVAVHNATGWYMEHPLSTGDSGNIMKEHTS
jgi:hypothetical protein